MGKSKWAKQAGAQVLTKSEGRVNVVTTAPPPLRLPVEPDRPATLRVLGSMFVPGGKGDGGRGGEGGRGDGGGGSGGGDEGGGGGVGGLGGCGFWLWWTLTWERVR